MFLVAKIMDFSETAKQSPRIFRFSMSKSESFIYTRRRDCGPPRRVIAIMFLLSQTSRSQTLCEHVKHKENRPYCVLTIVHKENRPYCVFKENLLCYCARKRGLHEQVLRLLFQMASHTQNYQKKYNSKRNYLLSVCWNDSENF